MTKVQGNTLIVAAPMKINKPAQPVAPPAVKTKVAQAKIEKGWSGVALSAAPTTSTPPTMAASPFEKGKGKGKPSEQAHPAVAAAPLGSPPGVETSPASAPEYSRPGKGSRGEQLRTTPAVTTPTGSPEGVAASPGGSTEHGKPGKRGEQPRTTPPVTAPTGGPEGVAAPAGGKHKRLEETGTPPAPPAGQAGPYSPTPSQIHRAESVNVPPAGPTTGLSPGAGRDEGKHEAKKKGEKESPAPSPQ